MPATKRTSAALNVARLTAVLGGSACATDNVCIGDPPPTVRVTAVDQVSGRVITDSVSGFARLGDRRTDLSPYAFAANGAALVLGAYLPAAGAYQVVVARAGYVPFDTIGVRVSTSECFPTGPSLTARLRPLPP